MQPTFGTAHAQPERPTVARVPREVVQGWMRDHLARLLGVRPDDLDPRENFLDLGVDSVQAMALLEALAEELGVTLAPEVFFEFPTLAELSGHLWATYPDQVGRRLGQSASPAPATPGEAGAAPAAVSAPVEPAPARPVRDTDVAIVGFAGRFPGAPTLDRFWENLCNGVDSISEVPADRWNLDAHYDPDPRAPNKTYLRYGGFLDDIYQFAPLFFHLSPREAAFLDPQQRLFLEIAWETIESAGYAGAGLRGTRTGVYVGVSSGEFLQSMIARQCEMASYVGTGNSPSIIPNRVSYHLNLRGPSIALDTACSSSLVAINLACQALARGEIEYALAGAVALSLHHGKYVYFSKAGMLAVDGRCKTFDARANGYVPGEGVAAVLLKPLAAALRDRDTIHGVIRGVGVNQDGRTNGITAPSPRAQRELCQQVYESFEIDPATISYVEAHGTGTPLGDPIEVSAISQAFARFTDRKQFCGIGSLKTNIGHTEPVAGVAGLCKVLLAMRHRQLPPTIHFEEVNPHIHFEETPFYLVDRLQEWHSEGPRRATVSAFSFGGVNAHVVVEEPPAALPATGEAVPRRPHLVTLAAMTDAALATLAARLDDHLAQRPELDLADVAYTLNVGRDHFDRRLALVVETREELRAELARASKRIAGAERAAEGQRRRRKARQPAFVLSGDPTDAMSALLALSSRHPDVRASIDEAEALAGPLTPDTALLVLQVTLARLWQTWGLKPAAVAADGPSDVAASVVAGARSFVDALSPAAGPGGIVPDSEASDETIPLLTPDQIAPDDHLAIPIGPAHADERRLAEIAAEAYRAGLDLDWPTWHRGTSAGRVVLPTYPFERQYIPPPPGRDEADASAPAPGAAGEAGQLDATPRAVSPAPGHNGSGPCTLRVEAPAGHGGDGRVTVVVEDADGRVIARYADVALSGDLLLTSGAPAANGKAAAPELEPLPPGLLHEVRWEPRPLAAPGQPPVGTYVLFGNGAVAEEVERALLAGGSRVIRVVPGAEYAEEGPDVFEVNPESSGDHLGLVVALQERGIEPTFVHLWGTDEQTRLVDDPRGLESRLSFGPYSVFALVQAIGRRRLGGPPALWVVTTDGLPAGPGTVRPDQAALTGLVRTIGQEYRHLSVVHVDLASAEQPAVRAAHLLAELGAGQPERAVAFRAGERLVPVLAPAESSGPRPGPRLRERGVYWITGGLGGLGRLVARHLAERYQARLVLSGRTVPPPRDQWDAYLASAAEDDATARVIRDLRAVEAAGGEVLVLDVDVAEAWQVKRAVTQIVRHYGTLHGVFHAAGVLRDGLIRSKEPATFREVLRPKVRGAICLERALQDRPLDFIALFGSLAGVAGNIGQSDYATANAFLDGFAWERRQAAGRPFVALDWSLWESGGMGANELVQRGARERGIVPIETATGLRALEAALALGRAQVVIGELSASVLESGTPGPAGRATPVAPPAPRLAATPAASEARVPATSPTVAAAPVAQPVPSVPAVPPATASTTPMPTAPTPVQTWTLAPEPEPLAPAPAPASDPAPADDPALLREFAEQWLLGLIGPRLGVAVTDIDPETPFLDLGIDSIIAGEIALDAGARLPVTFSPTMLLDYPTIADLAAFLCDQYPADLRALRAQLGLEPAAPAGAPEQASAAAQVATTPPPAGPPPGPPPADAPKNPPLSPFPAVNGEAPERARADVEDTGPLARRLADRADEPAGPRRLLTLAAPSERELVALAERYRALAAEPGGQSLDELCRAAGRAEQPHRLAVVAGSRQALAERLAAPSGMRGVVGTGSRPRVAFLFTGQGAQYQRMAESLYRAEPAFRAALDRSDAILRPHLDRPLLDLLYPADGGPRPLDQTAYTQPVTLAIDYALAQLWRSWGVEPTAVIGHSVGEYAAACVAGVFSLEDGLTLVARRARLMQGLPPGGGMLAVRADEATARSHLRGLYGVSVAALNGPSSVVLSGELALLDAVAERLKQAGVTAIRLSVSHAFHSGLMDPVLAPFEACFRAVTPRRPTIPLISNLTGAPAGAEIVEPEYWLRQLRQPVRFADGIRHLADDGIGAFLEVGPGTTLTGLAREVLGTTGSSGSADGGPLVVSSLVRGQDDREALLTALGSLWVRGATVDWSALDGPGSNGHAASPPPAAGLALEAVGPPTSAPAPAPAAPPDPLDWGLPGATPPPAPVTLFDDVANSGHVRRVLEQLRQGRLSQPDALSSLRPGVAPVRDGQP